MHIVLRGWAPYFGVVAVSALGAAGGCSAEGGAGNRGETVARASQALTAVVVSLDHNRNRLLDTLAPIKGFADRCALWASFDNIHRGIFLTHTDMLGNRSCMENASITSNTLNSQNNCDSSQPCNCPAGSDMALDHVFKLWTVNGNDPSCNCTEGSNGYNCCNGGIEWHRTFFGADDALIGYFRNYSYGLPEWGSANDIAGPHSPFNNESGTAKGTPAGQTNFWSYNTDAVVLQRGGVVGVFDPQIVELDNDYNWIHDSNPEGEYSGTYGRAVYKRNWHWGQYKNTNRGNEGSTDFAGNGQPGPISELDQTNYGIPADDVWSPRCPTAIISAGGVVNASDYEASDIHPSTWISIFGTGFASSGQTVYVRTRSTIDAIAPSYESATQINAQLPSTTGTGEAYVYVALGDAISNLQGVTIQP